MGPAALLAKWLTPVQFGWLRHRAYPTSVSANMATIAESARSMTTPILPCAIRYGAQGRLWASYVAADRIRGFGSGSFGETGSLTGGRKPHGPMVQTIGGQQWSTRRIRLACAGIACSQPPAPGHPKATFWRFRQPIHAIRTGGSRAATGRPYVEYCKIFRASMTALLMS